MMTTPSSVPPEEKGEDYYREAAEMWMEAAMCEESDNELMDEALAWIDRAARRALRGGPENESLGADEYRQVLRRIVRTARGARYANLSL